MKINLLPKGTKIPKFEKRSSRNHVAKETSNQVNNRILNQIVTGKILRKVAEFGGIWFIELQCYVQSAESFSHTTPPPSLLLPPTPLPDERKAKGLFASFRPFPQNEKN